MSETEEEEVEVKMEYKEVKRRNENFPSPAFLVGDRIKLMEKDLCKLAERAPSLVRYSPTRASKGGPS